MARIMDKAVDMERMLNAGERTETAVLAELGDRETKTRLDLLCEVGKKVGSVSQLTQLVEQVTQMTQRTLNASASSVRLLDDQERELLFEVAEGQARRQLRQARLSAQCGIAGWVARHGEPLIVNDVSKDKRFDKGVDATTGFVTKSIMCAPLVVHRKIIGVIEVLNKVDGSDFSGQDLEVLVSVAATAAMAIENTKLHQTVLNAYKSMIKALVATIDAKDPHTRGHSQRVTEYALLGATALSLSREELEVLEYAAILHDMGKIGIDERILTNPGRLTSEEWGIIRRHPLTGANILKDIPFLERARRLVLHHHERYDGNGYPHGLKGEDIPIGARLLAVADAYEAMTSPRPYRERTLTHKEALEELERNIGTQFDPDVVESFVDIMKKNSLVEAGVA